MSRATTPTPETVESNLNAIRREYISAMQNYPHGFASAHEGYAVILEELDELWDEVKKKQTHYDVKAMRKEAVQCAAMLLRFIVELT